MCVCVCVFVCVCVISTAERKVSLIAVTKATISLSGH